MMGRASIVMSSSSSAATKVLLENQARLNAMADAFDPDVIIHLAAQARVRSSLTSPQTYLDTNVIGAFNAMEEARRIKVQYLRMASTSSVFGAKTKNHSPRPRKLTPNSPS